MHKRMKACLIPATSRLSRRRLAGSVGGSVIKQAVRQSLTHMTASRIHVQLSHDFLQRLINPCEHVLILTSDMRTAEQVNIDMHHYGQLDVKFVAGR